MEIEIFSNMNFYKISWILHLSYYTSSKNYFINSLMINIALNTFREIVRNRFLYLILFFAFIFILFSLALAQLTIGESEKVVVDFWIAMIEIFGIIGVLFVGSQLLFKEIEGKTIFLILSKPIKRRDFLFWKFFGFSAAIFCIVFLQALLYLAVLFFQGIDITAMIIWSLLFTFFKLEILLAIVFFFSTFMGNMMTILVSLMVYVIAHSYSLILDLFFQMKSPAGVLFAKVLQIIFPPLQALNTKEFIGSFSDISAQYFIVNSLFAILYIGAILWCSSVIFSRKTFED